MKSYFRRQTALSIFAAAAFFTFAQTSAAQPNRPTAPKPKATPPPPAMMAPSGITAAPDAQMQRVLDNLAALKPIPIETLTPGEARYQPAFADALKLTIQKNTKMIPQPEPVGRIEEIMVGGAAGMIPARVYTPPGTGPFPVIVYYHGGGWVVASINTYDASARALTNGAGAIVVSVEYRKGPENKFPAAHDDAFAAYQWVLANAATFGGDAKRVAVVGESAGGNLAANVSIAARDKNVQAPLAQVLVYPIANNDLNAPSVRENTSPMLPLNAPKIPWFLSFYLTTPSESNDPRISLVKANLANLPPTTIINAQIDPLRSEGELLATRMRAAGVRVEQKTYMNVTHEFFGMGAVLDKAREADAQAFKALRTAFGN